MFQEESIKYGELWHCDYEASVHNQSKGKKKEEIGQKDNNIFLRVNICRHILINTHFSSLT